MTGILEMIYSIREVWAFRLVAETATAHAGVPGFNACLSGFQLRAKAALGSSSGSRQLLSLFRETWTEFQPPLHPGAAVAVEGI